MWTRLLNLLCCPLCAGELELRPYETESIEISGKHKSALKERTLEENDLNKYVCAGALLCDGCKTLYPVAHGVPICLPYTTLIHKEFAREFRDRLGECDGMYKFPAEVPITGEDVVLESFSQEWSGYDYDGVIWGMNYRDHEQRFLAEVGFRSPIQGQKTFLEIGCGIGLTTWLAQKNYAVESVGVDLSTAVIKAAEYFKGNPFIHFVQASAFRLPLRRQIADIVYSHGVLHHTISTREAFKAIVPHCRPEGLVYIWVYGSGSKRHGIFRRFAYLLEAATRRFIGQHLSSCFSRIFLRLMACAYLLANALERMRKPRLMRYDFRRALHAARDRFTPLYAHRQDYEEVAGWFREAGFDEVQEVDWRAMPAADQANYRRNTGVRGRLGRGFPKVAV